MSALLRACVLLGLPVALAWLLWDGLVPRLWDLQWALGGALVGLWACALVGLAVRTLRARGRAAGEAVGGATPSAESMRDDRDGRSGAALRTIAWSVASLVMLVMLALSLLQLVDGRVGTRTRILRAERVLTGGETVFVFSVPRLLKASDTSIYLAEPGALTMRHLLTLPAAHLEGSPWFVEEEPKIVLPFAPSGSLRAALGGHRRFEVVVDPRWPHARRRRWSGGAPPAHSMSPEQARGLAVLEMLIAPKFRRCPELRGVDRLPVRVEVDPTGLGRVSEESSSEVAVACVEPLLEGRTIFPASAEGFALDYVFDAQGEGAH